MSYRCRILVYGFLFLTTATLWGQAPASTLRAVIRDAETREILSFATVLNQRLGAGTASNADGLVVLPDVLPGDTLRVQYLGYANRQLVVGEVPPPYIDLRPLVNVLSEVVITSNDDELFDLLHAVTKRQRAPARTAKTYFFLETTLDDERAEIIEAYYNGTYADRGTEAWALKKGRIGLRPVRGHYFSSTGSSRLFSMHRLFESNTYFPESPFTLSRKELREAYRLSLQDILREDGAEDLRDRFRAPKPVGNTVWRSGMDRSYPQPAFAGGATHRRRRAASLPADRKDPDRSRGYAGE